MREDELRKNAVCDICGNGIGRDWQTLFYTMNVTRYELDITALKRNAGMVEMMGGSVTLARIMGPDEEMAHKTDRVSKTICSKCHERIEKILTEAEHE